MKVSHIIWSIDSSKGGPSRSVTHLLICMGHIFPHLTTELHTAQSQNPILRKFTQSSVSLKFYNYKRLGRLKGLEETLLLSKANLFHGQAIWDLPVHQMAKTARKLNVP